jgi:hypothetical protein
MSVCVWLCVCVFVWEVRVCVCEWRGEFNRVVLVVQLGLIFHFILNPEQRRLFQLVLNINDSSEQCGYLHTALLNFHVIYPRFNAMNCKYFGSREISRICVLPVSVTINVSFLIEYLPSLQYLSMAIDANCPW